MNGDASEIALLSDWTGFKITNQDSIPDPCLSLQENKIEIIKILKSIFIFELIFNNLKSLIQSLCFNFKTVLCEILKHKLRYINNHLKSVTLKRTFQKKNIHKD
ncbi:hypothetical protein LEP1GSC044_0154 [Leptospira kirschneri serovar Grippotyphosa str. RM52]|nr:hypothetical protein LEP1GSC044_0154 [Leptospira kirschneri serovar Grippotyphosa str. RM52]